MREKTAEFFIKLQKEICQAFENFEPEAKFANDNWERTDPDGSPGGGGLTRVIQGKVFEKGGVNFSKVFGTAPESITKHIGAGDKMFATGISLVMHPYSPLVPTVHANLRYIEFGKTCWFGGGMDLTPYKLYREDATHFHKCIKAVCDQHDPYYYPNFKQECDKYFFIKHRQEARGIGGVFFDYLGRNEPDKHEAIFEFIKDLGAKFVECYCPIVERRKTESFTTEEKNFQLLRRGRYVEFNLCYDRGTKFGLETNGRTESILMSLPPEVHWEYDYQIIPGSKEAELIEVLKNPVNWI